MECHPSCWWGFIVGALCAGGLGTALVGGIAYLLDISADAHMLLDGIEWGLFCR